MTDWLGRVRWSISILYSYLAGSKPPWTICSIHHECHEVTGDGRPGTPVAFTNREIDGWVLAPAQ